MAKGPERQYTDRLLGELRRLPQSWWVKIAAGPWQTPGLPDIIGCLRGWFVAVEVKVHGRETEAHGGLTQRQKAILEEIGMTRGYPFVVYTSKTPKEAASVISAGVPFPG